MAIICPILRAIHCGACRGAVEKKIILHDRGVAIIIIVVIIVIIVAIITIVIAHTIIIIIIVIILIIMTTTTIVIVTVIITIVIVVVATIIIIITITIVIIKFVVVSHFGLQRGAHRAPFFALVAASPRCRAGLVGQGRQSAPLRQRRWQIDGASWRL